MKYRKSQFDNLEKKNVKKSLFDLSHEFKTQMCFGRYYPVLCEEALPNDVFHIDAEYMYRFPSTYFPIQQIGTMRADWFYCPMKLLWRGDSYGTNNLQKTGWQGFIQGESLDFPTTFLNINGAGFAGSSSQQLYPGCSYPIENYMGFPYDRTGRLDEDKQMALDENAMPLAMYLFCYDEWYRNPQWEDENFFPLKDGSNAIEFAAVQQVVDGIIQVDWAQTGSGEAIINHAPFFAHYAKDYFTSARPEPQDGESIKIPTHSFDEFGNAIPNKFTTAGGGVTAGTAEFKSDGTLNDGDDTAVSIVPEAEIKQLRIAQVLQQFHERVMRIGKRYRNYIEGLWGNDPEPNAIDIPQLIGSHFGRIQITDSVTTADTSEAKTGNYRGNINFHNNGTKHHYFCQDYGYIMCIINVMPNTAYQQGMHPMWSRRVNTDFALDMFSGIGDQEIKRKELHVLNNKTIWEDPTEPFNGTIGYQDRFGEYKTRVNRMFTTSDLYDPLYMGQKLTGVEEDYDEITAGRLLVASSYPTSNGLREADIFNSLPIKSGASLYTDATIFAHMYFDIKVERCLPYFSTPGKQIF